MVDKCRICGLNECSQFMEAVLVDFLVSFHSHLFIHLFIDYSNPRVPSFECRLFSLSPVAHI